MATQPAGQLSPDGKFYWDGQQWVSSISPDGRHRWNGTQWLPYRRMRFGEYVTQSIVLLVGGVITVIFCWFLGFAFFGLGLAAGIMGLRHTPTRQTQAIIGIVGNGVGLLGSLLLFIFSLAYHASR